MVSEQKASLYFWLFLGLHVFVWTLYPIVNNWSLPADMVENFYLGQAWQWGYYKHPPLFSWVTAAYLKSTDVSRGNYYLLSQLNVAFTFFMVWRLAKLVLTPLYALLAVVMLEFIPYYSFLSIKFNANTILLSTWALTVYFTYLAITKQKSFYWLMLGLSAAAAMLGKYFSICLLLGILIYLLSHRRGRNLFKTRGPYVALIGYFLLMTPHLLWLWGNDFASIRYGMERAQEGGWVDSRLDGVKFIVSQMAYMMPLILVMVVFVRRFSFISIFYRVSALSSDAGFCWAMSMGVCLLIFILSIIFGLGVASVWGMPLWNVLGILVFLYLAKQMPCRPLRIYAFAMGYLVLVPGAIMLGNALWVDDAQEKALIASRQELAWQLTLKWRERYGLPLKVVAGHDAGAVAFYSSDHPDVSLGESGSLTPWVTKERIHQGGIALILGDAKPKKTAEPLKNGQFEVPTPRGYYLCEFMGPSLQEERF